MPEWATFPGEIFDLRTPSKPLQMSGSATFPREISDGETFTQVAGSRQIRNFPRECRTFRLLKELLGVPNQRIPGESYSTF